MKLQNHRTPAFIALLCSAALFIGCAHKKAYMRALEYEKSGRHVEAARKDIEALDKKPGYEEAFAHLQQVAPLAYQELLNRAETFEANAQWLEAVQNYNELESLLQRFVRHNIVLQTLDVSSHKAQARDKGAAHHYDNAERYFGAGDYDQAISQYKKVTALADYHRDTKDKLGKCINANLKFAVFINRANLEQIFEEYKLSQSGAVDERRAVEIGKLEGLHSFVTGAITEISVQTESPSFIEKTHDKVYTVKDSAGKSIEKTDKIYYREYAAKRTAQIYASFQIVDVETGRYLSGETLSESSEDKAQWVRYQDSVYDLPKDKQKLLDASGEPKAAEIMINDLVRRIAGKMSERILRFYQ